MGENTRAQRFAEALQDFESSGAAAELAAHFAPDAQLSRPELDQEREPSHDVEAFWDGYLSPFAHIATEFTHVAEAEDLAVLEWRSRGSLTTGRSIDYAGVSLLTYDADDKVVRFATYFDTAAFTHGNDAAPTEV